MLGVLVVISAIVLRAGKLFYCFKTQTKAFVLKRFAFFVKIDLSKMRVVNNMLGVVFVVVAFVLRTCQLVYFQFVLNALLMM